MPGTIVLGLAFIRPGKHKQQRKHEALASVVDLQMQLKSNYNEYNGQTCKAKEEIATQQVGIVCTLMTVLRISSM